MLRMLTAASGTSRTPRDVRLESAKWGKADVDQVAVTNLGSARQLRLRPAAMPLTLGKTIELQHHVHAVEHQRCFDPATQHAQAQCDDRLAQLGRAGDVAVPRVVAHGDLKSLAHLLRLWASSASARAAASSAVKTTTLSSDNVLRMPVMASSDLT